MQVVARVRVLLALSTALLERRGAAVALEAIERALTEAQGSRTLAAMCHSQRAVVHGRSGRPAEALRELDQAVSALAEMPPRDQFVILLSRGMVRMDLADAVGAQADFAAAVELSVEHGMTGQEFMARHNLGCAVALAGDLPRALQLMLEADRVPTDISRVVAKLDRARLLLEAGMLGEGAALLAEAARGGQESEQRLVSGEIDLELARVLVLLGDVDGAQEAARRARRTFPKDVGALRRRADLVLLIAQCQRGVKLGRVAAQAERLAEEFDADGDRVAWGMARLVEAEALAREGRWAEAEDRLAGVATMRRSVSLSAQLRHRRVAAMVALGQGDDARAGRELRAAARVLGRALATSGSIDLRAATSLHAEELSRLDRSLAERRGPGAVLVALERWRSISSAVPLVRPPADGELRSRVVTLRRLRSEIQEHPELTSRLREQVRVLEREVATRSWAAGGQDLAGAVDTPVRTVSRAREQLRELDSDLVVYGHDGQRLGAVVLSRGRARVHDLAPLEQVMEAQRRLHADLAACATVGQSRLREVVLASLARSAQECRRLLLEPLRLRDRVLVVPAERMLALPWGLLRGSHASGLPTTIAPSLAVWLRGARAVGAPRVSTLAGPGLPLAPAEARRVSQVWREAPVWPGGLGGGCGLGGDGDLGGGAALVGGRGEVSDGTQGEAAYSTQGGAAYSTQDEVANGAQLHAALEGSDVLHVAAHGTHQSDSPLLSSVWMSDGPVFLCDLEQTQRTASLVVVSACDAGRSQGRGRGQHLGLASGLLALGVGTVVAAVGPVPDHTAAELMPRFHAHLRAGRECSEALALATADCADPLAGAFVAMGSPWKLDAALGSPGPTSATLLSSTQDAS